MKKIWIFFLAYLFNVRSALAAPADYDVDRWTDTTSQAYKLHGAIWWVGQGAKYAGVIAIIFGAWQFGMSFSSDEPGNRNKALMFLACGVILFLTPAVLTLLMQWKIIDPGAW